MLKMNPSAAPFGMREIHPVPADNELIQVKFMRSKQALPVQNLLCFNKKILYLFL